jgi:hypothetical protein
VTNEMATYVMYWLVYNAFVAQILPIIKSSNVPSDVLLPVLALFSVGALDDGSVRLLVVSAPSSSHEDRRMHVT